MTKAELYVNSDIGRKVQKRDSDNSERLLYHLLRGVTVLLIIITHGMHLSLVMHNVHIYRGLANR